MRLGEIPDWYLEQTQMLWGQPPSAVGTEKRKRKKLVCREHWWRYMLIEGRCCRSPVNAPVSDTRPLESRTAIPTGVMIFATKKQSSLGPGPVSF